MAKTLTLVFAFLLSANIFSDSAFAQYYSAKTDFTTGTNPFGITIGDFNGDGKPDFASVNNGSSNVSVLLNTTTTGASTPTFSAASNFATGIAPYHVTSSDLNGDGKPDLIIVNAVGTVSVLLNTTVTGNATPTFSAAVNFTVGTNPQFVSIGDLNGDGKLDLAVANFNSNNVSVLFNTTPTGNATPTFSAASNFAAGTGPNAVATGDLNGDGKPDLAVANVTTGNASVLLNTTATGAATPTFSAATNFTTGTNAYCVSIGDLNGDGKPDLAVASQNTNTVSVLLNTTAPGASTPTFSAKTDFTAGSSTAAVVIGDLNNDGKPDLVTVNSNASTVSVLLNTSAPGAATPTFTAKTDFTTGSGPQKVSIGDFNGDGKPDLAVANLFSNSVSVFLNTMTLGVTPASISAKTDFTTGLSPLGLSFGDFNGDGKQDMAVANNVSNSVSVFLNTTTPGSSTPTFSAKTDFTTGTNPYRVSIGDFNGDGKPDMALPNSGTTTVSVFLNTTTPGASTPTFSTKTDFTAGSVPVSVVTCDFNGDGKPDMAVANNLTNTVSVFFNTTTPGASTPTFSAKSDFASGTNPHGISIVDLNGDGKPDMVVSNQGSNTVSVFLNTTTPGASTPTFTAKTDFTTGTNPISVSIGDFNGDGKPDMAVVNYGLSTVSVFFNTTAPGASTPTFSTKTDYTTGNGPAFVTIGDFNGDGKPDLASTNYDANTVSVLLNSTAPGASTPTFSTKTDYTTGTGPYSVSTVDFNGDGLKDIAVSNNSSNTVSVLLNTAVLPLPVELASFTSNVNSNNVTLNWSTVQEQNNKGFEIERNSFGAGWKKIGYVEGNGTTNTPQNYTFKDNSLNTGTYSYRLKQIDYNGNFEYFELSNEVAIGVPNRYSLAQNYPNPFNPVTKINYELPFDCKVSIKIFDMTSREVAQIVNATHTAGYYTAQFNGTNLASGVYFYNIIAEGGNAAKFVNTKKMVLVK